MRGRHALIARAAQTVTQSRGELAHVVGAHDEIVEEVLAKREVVELVVVEQQDDRSNAALALAKLATEAHRVGEGQARPR